MGGGIQHAMEGPGIGKEMGLKTKEGRKGLLAIHFCSSTVEFADCNKPLTIYFDQSSATLIRIRSLLNTEVDKRLPKRTTS